MTSIPIPVIRLFISLIKEKSANDSSLASLWKTDFEKYGADEEIIAKYKGRAEAYTQVSEDLESFLEDYK